MASLKHLAPFHKSRGLFWVVSHNTGYTLNTKPYSVVGSIQRGYIPKPSTLHLYIHISISISISIFIYFYSNVGSILGSPPFMETTILGSQGQDVELVLGLGFRVYGFGCKVCCSTPTPEK